MQRANPEDAIRYCLIWSIRFEQSAYPPEPDLFCDQCVAAVRPDLVEMRR